MRLSRVRSIFRSAASLRLRNRVVPAASSMKSRRSSGFALTSCSTRPCSMIAYAFVPTPVPRKSSVMSLQATRRAVDEVLGLARAEVAPRDQDLAQRSPAPAGGPRPAHRPRPARRSAARSQVLVVALEQQRHLRHAERPVVGVAGEDDVLHRGAAEMLRALLAEHPADRVDDVRLAAAVRADDRGDAATAARERSAP